MKISVVNATAFPYDDLGRLERSGNLGINVAAPDRLERLAVAQAGELCRGQHELFDARFEDKMIDALT
ncbi:MAG TPA: hypothetical protein PLN52_25950 [Opitutaceae bacterium]|nr:hypothetical protein [Opitutaceae bacterium]